MKAEITGYLEVMIPTLKTWYWILHNNYSANIAWFPSRRYTTTL
ncbi:hypothetical protein OK016_29630 [Vibrio chagasii]|nr:hypothetical protein [Vibrio chagasii]